MDTLNENDDEDLTFIPHSIIDHSGRNIPRKTRRTTKDGKTILEVKMNSHVKIRVF